jgi:tight adherence protein B
MPLAIALLVFTSIVGLTVGVSWRVAARRTIRQRLAHTPQPSADGSAILREDRRGREGRASQLGRLPGYDALLLLIEQSGRPLRPRTVLAAAGGCAVGGAVIAAERTGPGLLVVVCAALAAGVPLLFLLYKRQRRMKRFEQQLPDALDMMTRGIRAGYALAASIQLVADEMPEPVGEELRRVFEEISLGGEPSEALAKLPRRVPLEDVRFFCAAIRIQRMGGGNLAEMLDRLAEVIRERLKLLSHARAVSAQQKWAAIIIGVSPFILGLFFRLLSPRYFDPLLNSPAGPKLIMTGLLLEAIGFLIIWRIAKIKT